MLFSRTSDRKGSMVRLPGRVRRFLIGAVACVFVVPMATSAMDWRGITPARSGKDTVRSRLGRPSQEGPDRMEFEGKSGKTVIFFYTEQDTQSLNLDPQLAGKVLTIYYYPKRPARYDLKALATKVVAVGHGVTIEGETMVSYDDGEHGISYHFKGDDPHVWRIVYYAPRAEFAKYRRSTGDDQNR